MLYRCDDCGATEPKWAGRCAGCGAWNSLREDVGVAPGPDPLALALAGAAAVPIVEVEASGGEPRATGLAEVDRVLGGGLVPGSVTLLGGEPGIGKSTLLLQLAAAQGHRVLYATGEESAHQVRHRAERLGTLSPHLFVAPGSDLDAVVAQVDAVAPSLLVLDSVQTVADRQLGSLPGSVVQVRGCAQRLVAEAKRRDLAVVLVGHVTKEGAIAGPRVLEHLVDTVLSFDGDRHHALRLLRAVKHRFGATDELGLFEMTDGGLRGVPDASALFLTDRQPGAAGSMVVPVLEGRRTLLVEVQALVTPSSLAAPRRSAQGLDQSRLAMLLAVLWSRAGVSVQQADVFASVVGGLRLTEPGADLGVCLAVASAASGTPAPADLVASGEVGLAGELRQVPHTQRRVAEAARLGFRRAVVPASADVHVPGMHIVRVRSLHEALQAVLQPDSGLDRAGAPGRGCGTS
jgi:DNA repair protein RadA/Sms